MGNAICLFEAKSTSLEIVNVGLKRPTLWQNLLDKLKSLVQRYSSKRYSSNLPKVVHLRDNLLDRFASEGNFPAGGNMPGDGDKLAGCRLGKASCCPYLVFTMTWDLRP